MPDLFVPFFLYLTVPYPLHSLSIVGTMSLITCQLVSENCVEGFIVIHESCLIFKLIPFVFHVLDQ